MKDNLNDANIEMIQNLYFAGFVFILENGRIKNMIKEGTPEEKT